MTDLGVLNGSSRHEPNPIPIGFGNLMDSNLGRIHDTHSHSLIFSTVRSASIIVQMNPEVRETDRDPLRDSCPLRLWTADLPEREKGTGSPPPRRSFPLPQIRERPMRGGKGRLASPPVIAVISLIGVVYYITVFVFVDDLLGLSTSPGRLSAWIFSWLAIMCLFSFFVAVLTDPGCVPPSFAPETEDPLKFVSYCSP